MSSPGHPTLLTLPPELRLAIYDQVLYDKHWQNGRSTCVRGDTSIHSHGQGRHCKPCALLDSLPVSLPHTPIVFLQGPLRLQIGSASSKYSHTFPDSLCSRCDSKSPKANFGSLLRVCRLVHDEFLNHMCERTLFMVELENTNYLNDPLSSWSRTYHSKLLERARYVHIDIGLMSTEDFLPMENMLRSFATKLNKNRKRTSVKLSIHQVQKPLPGRRGMSSMDKWRGFLRGMRCLDWQCPIEIQHPAFERNIWLSGGSRFMEDLRNAVGTVTQEERCTPYQVC